MALVMRDTPIVILMGVSLGAIANGSLQALVITLSGDLAGDRQRGRAIGLVHTAGDLGSAIGPPVAYALLPAVGLDGVYLLCTGLFAVGWILARTR